MASHPIVLDIEHIALGDVVATVTVVHGLVSMIDTATVCAMHTALN